MNMNTDWAQKYRPTNLNDVILPENIKSKLEKFVNKNGGMSLLFHGRPGCGKTTVAKLINPINTYQIDCATNRSIEMVRNLETVCSAVTLNGGRRLVLLDEADHLTSSAQVALRGVIETCSVITDFVMTANEVNDINQPLRSRCLPIHFELISEVGLLGRFKNRVYEILKIEGVDKYDKYIVDQIIEKDFPDLRRILKQLQFELG